MNKNNNKDRAQKPNQVINQDRNQDNNTATDKNREKDKDKDKDRKNDFIASFNPKQLQEIIEVSKTKFKDNEFLEYTPTQTTIYQKSKKKYAIRNKK